MWILSWSGFGWSGCLSRWGWFVPHGCSSGQLRCVVLCSIPLGYSAVLAAMVTLPACRVSGRWGRRPRSVTPCTVKLLSRPENLRRVHFRVRRSDGRRPHCLTSCAINITSGGLRVAPVALSAWLVWIVSRGSKFPYCVVKSMTPQAY